MRTPLIVLLLFVTACVSPSPEPVLPKPTPATPATRRPLVPLEVDLLNEYDIWEFLSAKPAEGDVLNLLGQPDSIWVDEDNTYKVWYYYRPEYQDYNSVEIELPSHRVTGFEWD